MRPGAWELRRLHRVDAEGDGAKADSADEDLMRKLGNFVEKSTRAARNPGFYI